MKTVLIKALKGYKKWISPHLGNNCRFLPTCSEYAMQAIEIHGSFKGILLTFWRLLRCNPFGKVGYDPPPEKGEWVNPKRQLRKN
ncbi:membrane protein insertion efficiency factor YidD [Ruminococcaceae bacterium OttesenSCG-928-I18]|nr:membrane protein insertion efficiency factor YidD [Ruminococcaceae bacterium OttesenSCG-928-I18]